MFDYHNSPYCSFDIWAPNPTTWGDNAIENRAFSSYAMHTQEVEDVIEMIGEGETSIINCDLTPNEIRYIEDEVHERYGLEVQLT